MKPELVAQLRGRLSERQLPSTAADADAKTEHATDTSVRLAVRALLVTTDALLADAEKRRRDIEEWAGRHLDSETLVAGFRELGDLRAQVEQLEQQAADDRAWFLRAIGVLIGVWLPVQALVLLAIAWLAWR